MTATLCDVCKTARAQFHLTKVREIGSQAELAWMMCNSQGQREGADFCLPHLIEFANSAEATR